MQGVASYALELLRAVPDLDVVYVPIDLPLPLTAQYYDGSNFVTNTLDSCTRLAASTIRMAAVATPDLVATA